MTSKLRTATLDINTAKNHVTDYAQTIIFADKNYIITRDGNVLGLSPIGSPIGLLFSGIGYLLGSVLGRGGKPASKGATITNDEVAVA